MTYNTLVFPLGHPLFAFLCNWVLDTRGIRVGCVLGSLLTIAGVVLRTFINQSFWLVIAGSTLCAVGNIFILNSPSKLAANWWSSGHLTAVNSLCTLANIVSNTIGAVIPSFFVSMDSGRQDIVNLLRFEAGLVGGVLLLLIVFIRDKPGSPPSLAAAAEEKEPYLASLRRLVTNRNYLLLLLSVSMGYGCLISFFATVEFYIHPFNFSSNAQIVSLLLASATVAGLVGSAFVSYVVKRSLRFKRVLVVCYCGAAAQMLLLYFSFQVGSLALVVLSGACVGFFILPVTPLILQLGCEVAFPVKEATVAGLLLAGAQVTGFVIGFPMLELYDKVLDSSWYATLIFTAMFLLGGLLVSLARIELRRTAFDRRLQAE